LFDEVEKYIFCVIGVFLEKNIFSRTVGESVYNNKKKERNYNPKQKMES